MITSTPLHALTPATHTPFHADGSLNLQPIEDQCAHLLKWGIATVFIGGTTGEFPSLTLEERLRLCERWMQVTRGTRLQVVVHVGSNCLEDASALAAQAQRLGALAVSALAPCYFKPGNVEMLVACCARMAAAAPDLPFYYYEIPGLTGVKISCADFLHRAAGAIPNLRGVKFTNPDLMTYQECLHHGEWDIPWGLDELMLGALGMGAKGAVGSSFNFAAPIYQRLMAAFARGDMETARMEQWRSVQLISLLGKYGYMSGAKAVMDMLGVSVGAPRLPFAPLSVEQKSGLRLELEKLGYFAWIQP